MINWLIRIGDALSQFANTALLNGDPNESISGRSYRQGWCVMYFIDALFAPFESQHCKRAYLNDVKKARKLMKFHKRRAAL